MAQSYPYQDPLTHYWEVLCIYLGDAACSATEDAAQLNFKINNQYIHGFIGRKMLVVIICCRGDFSSFYRMSTQADNTVRQIKKDLAGRGRSKVFG